MPHRLELVLHTEDGEQTSPMIFRFEGDELLIGYAPPGKPRPTDFVSEQGSQQTVIRMRRVKGRSNTEGTVQ